MKADKSDTGSMTVPSSVTSRRTLFAAFVVTLDIWLAIVPTANVARTGATMLVAVPNLADLQALVRAMPLTVNTR